MRLALSFATLGMLFTYFVVVEQIANFITRDLPKLQEALKVTEEEAIKSADSYRKYLQHQPIENLLDKVAPEGDANLPSQDEIEYVKEQVVVFQDLLSQVDPMESGTQMSNGKVPLEMVIYDNIYKRIMIDILMDRTFD